MGSDSGGASTHADRRELLWLAAIVAFAALLRAVRWGQTAVLFNDGPVFIGLARAMAADDLSRALAHPYHPLYPALMAAVELGTGSFETAGVIVSVVGGSAAVLALHALVRSVFGASTALTAAFLLAVHPLAIEFSGDVQSEGLYLGCFVGGLALLWRALRIGSAGAAFAAGVLSGLAYLTRPEGLGIVVLGVGLGSWKLLARRWSLACAIRVSAACLAGAILVGSPYVRALHGITGQWQLTQKKSVGALVGAGDRQRSPATSPPAPDPVAPADPSAAPFAGQEVVSPPRRPVTPAGLPRRLAGAALELGDAALSTMRPAFLLLLGVGLLHRRGRPAEYGGFALAVAGLYGVVLLGLTLNVGYVSRRHLLPPLVPGFAYAALGIGVLGRALIRYLPGRSGLADPRLATVLLLVLVAGTSMAKALKPQRAEELAVRRAAEWLAGQDLPAGLVAARKQRVAYYAGAPYYRLVEDAGWSSPEALRRHEVRYVILEDAKLKLYPELRAAVPAQLRPIHREETGGSEATVFLVDPASAPTPGGGGQGG